MYTIRNLFAFLAVIENLKQKQRHSKLSKNSIEFTKTWSAKPNTNVVLIIGTKWGGNSHVQCSCLVRSSDGYWNNRYPVLKPILVVVLIHFGTVLDCSTSYLTSNTDREGADNRFLLQGLELPLHAVFQPSMPPKGSEVARLLVTTLISNLPYTKLWMQYFRLCVGLSYEIWG